MYLCFKSASSSSVGTGTKFTCFSGRIVQGFTIVLEWYIDDWEIGVQILVGVELHFAALPESHNGHSVCGSCKSTLSLCPVCKDKFPAEELFNKLKKPCKNRPFGCKEESLVKDCLILHEGRCRYKFIECKAMSLSKEINRHCCDWVGKYDSIFEHVEKSHKQCAIIGSEDLFIYKGKNGVYPSFYLVKDYDELFWIYSKIDWR
ncbi:unnamed protein product, partial [Timema podura]|nr:unnamed protein product [Timema podura]